MTDNKPHRGARNNSNRQHHRTSKTTDILPAPELLEAYDYIVEGSAQQLLTMFASEQEHRHKWEMRALQTHHTSTVLGQILGFFVCLSIFISASVIGIYGNQVIAATIWIFGLAIITMTGLVWVYTKMLGQRPLFGRPKLRTHFRPEKEDKTPGAVQERKDAQKVSQESKGK